MRSFTVLAFVAAASAGLLPNTGYNYGIGESAREIVSANSYGNTGQGLGTIGVGMGALNSVPQTVEYSKHFYRFTAPEEQHNQGVINKKESNVLKKNLQVVFIKAPENNAATNAALQLAKQAIEQRTVIYVLSRENNASQVVGQLQKIQKNVQTGPEVKFIKYRTPYDIAYAKEIIQSQYDNGEGSSQTFDGGVAPVLNYASRSRGPSFGVNYISSRGLSGNVKYSGIRGSSLSNFAGASGTLLNTNAKYSPVNHL